jgi:hypothetical protein
MQPVQVTTESPDKLDAVLSGPLDGQFCETFGLLDKLANECGGGWEDWEPYRCTYTFPSKQKSNEFCKRMVIEGIWEARKVNVKQKEWIDDVKE